MNFTKSKKISFINFMYLKDSNKQNILADLIQELSFLLSFYLRSLFFLDNLLLQKLRKAGKLLQLTRKRSILSTETRSSFQTRELVEFGN